MFAQRNFKFVTMLGFASTVMASWEVLLVLFKLILTDGGTPNLFWGIFRENLLTGMSAKRHQASSSTPAVCFSCTQV